MMKVTFKEIVKIMASERVNVRGHTGYATSLSQYWSVIQLFCTTFYQSRNNPRDEINNKINLIHSMPV